MENLLKKQTNKNKQNKTKQKQTNKKQKEKQEKIDLLSKLMETKHGFPNTSKLFEAGGIVC